MSVSLDWEEMFGVDRMRNNSLGNANIAGLTSDLQISSPQFSMALVVYYCKPGDISIRGSRVFD